MFEIPSLPPYEGLHPIVVHFPIAILMMAWVPMLLGLVDKKRRMTWLFGGLLMLLVGTGFAFFAVMTGSATEHAVDRSSQVIRKAIHEHEETAELARNLFIGVTVIYIFVLIAVSKIGQSKKKLVGLVGSVLIVVSYGFAGLALANAGHEGGLLVHQLGVRAPMGPVVDVNAPVETPANDLELEHED